MKITPRNDFVLIEMIAPPAKSAGGILLTESSKDKGVFKQAKILALGPKANFVKTEEFSLDGVKQNELRIGSTVLVNTMTSFIVDPSNESVKMIRAEDIVANVG